MLQAMPILPELHDLKISPPHPGLFKLRILLLPPLFNHQAFITKLNPSGTALVYSTYLGGSKATFGDAIEIDGAGNAYVTGSTSSLDFPITADAFQTSLAVHAGGGGTDAFVTKLNSSGSGLVYSTYLGGDNTETLWA